MNVVRMLRSSPAAELFHVSRDGRVEKYTQERLFRGVAGTALRLREAGVGIDDHVLVLVGNGFQSLEVILAVLAVGATAVPLDLRTGNASITEISQDIHPKCCVVCGRVPFDLESRIRDMRIAFVAVEQFGVRAVDERSPGPRPVEEPFDVVDVDAERTALVLYTSGSTGRPKGVRRTQRQLAAFVELNHVLFSQYYGEGGANPLITAMPLSHMSGLGYCFEGLYSSTAVYLVEEFDAAVILRLVERLRCRLLIMLPSMYELLLHEARRRVDVDLTSLRYCLYGGEACPPALCSRIRDGLGAEPISAYGLTEGLTGIGHARETLLRGKVKPNSCGTRLFGEMKLVDELGNERTDFGELWIRNGTTPKTAEEGGSLRVTPEGWFRTGDLLEKDEEGNYFHRGRPCPSARAADDRQIERGPARRDWAPFAARVESALLRSRRTGGLPSPPQWCVRDHS
jgi:long-chain acyl-CoA synthetase